MERKALCSLSIVKRIDWMIPWHKQWRKLKRKKRVVIRVRVIREYWRRRVSCASPWMSAVLHVPPMNTRS